MRRRFPENGHSNDRASDDGDPSVAHGERAHEGGSEGAPRSDPEDMAGPSPADGADALPMCRFRDNHGTVGEVRWDWSIHYDGPWGTDVDRIVERVREAYHTEPTPVLNPQTAVMLALVTLPIERVSAVE